MKIGTVINNGTINDIHDNYQVVVNGSYVPICQSTLKSPNKNVEDAPVAQKSKYLLALLDLQKKSCLDDSLVSEILDTTCMFEQLYCAWSVQLPFGEGPDADVNFVYWKEYSSWRNLVDCAQQNVCIDNTTVGLGNGMTSDNAPIKRRKNYKKNLNAAFKHTNYPDTQHAVDFFKLIENDKSGMLTFGSIVYNAVQSLILVLNKIHLLLENPTDEQLFIDYFDKQLARFKAELTEWDLRIKNKMKEPIQERRKANALHQFQDDLRDALRNSGFLNDLMAGITKYDVNDYREANPDLELSEDEVKEELALNDLLTPSGEPDKKQIAHYLYSHRKQFSRETISTFFAYIIINEEIEKRLSLMGVSAAPTRVEANDSETPSVVDAIREGFKDVAGAIRENPPINAERYYAPGSTHEDKGKYLQIGKDDKNALGLIEL